MTDEELRKYLTKRHLPNVAEGDELRCMRLCVRMADKVALDHDDEGAIEWVLFTFGDEEFAWSQDDGWDGDPPFEHVVCALKDALDGAALALGSRGRVQ